MTGPTFASKMTANGSRQGSVTLYRYNSYPHSCIGQVSFLWKPSSDNTSTLWISCHPSFYHSAESEIRKCFEEEPTLTVEVKSLKDGFGKIRLFGPGSNVVLSEVLRTASISTKESSLLQVNGVSEIKENGTDLKETISDLSTDQSMKSKNKWWKEYYSGNEMVDRHTAQVEAWTKVRNCSSPAVAPPHCVLGLTVRDPRLLLPPKRNKISTLGSGMSFLSENTTF